MKIINTTQWATRDISGIVRRVVRERIVKYGRRPDLARALVVTIKYRRRGSPYAGRATVSRPGVIYRRINMSLMLPRYPGRVDPVQLASTTHHECDHIRGLEHRDMVLHQHPRFFHWAVGKAIRWRGPVQEQKAAAATWTQEPGRAQIDWMRGYNFYPSTGGPKGGAE